MKINWMLKLIDLSNIALEKARIEFLHRIKTTILFNHICVCIFWIKIDHTGIQWPLLAKIVFNVNIYAWNSL